MTTTPRTVNLIDRTTAVDEIAERLAAKDTFLAVAGPTAIASGFLARLAPIRFDRAWIDSGAVVAVDNPVDLAALVPALGRLVPLVAVLAAPKTAANRRAVRGLPDSQHSNQDLIVATDPDGRVEWPLLFVDAVALVDPHAADTIVSSALAGTRA